MSKREVRKDVIERVANRANSDDRINDLIENFQLYLDYFTNNFKFSGPSVYFHRKTIDKIRTTQDYNELLGDTYFLELIYATLVSWGMLPMGNRGPKVAEFEDFKAGISEEREQLVELQQYQLHTLTDDQFNQIKPLLQIVFRKLKTIASGSNLVENSKAMHYLLPDLIPPIDRTHTLKFFYRNTRIVGDELRIFFECFENFHRVAVTINWNVYELKDFNTSIPKIIDNAIMGFVNKNLK